MHLRKNLMAVALVAALATLIPSGGSPLAGGDSRVDVDVREGGNVRVITTDEDGEVRERVYGLHDSGTYLGVRLNRHDRHGRRSSGESDGARIDRVIEDSPADQAGLQDGDIVLGFDGHDIRDAGDLTDRIHESEPGDRIDLEIERDGRIQTLRVELGESKSHGRSFNFSGLEGLQGLESLEGLEDFEFDAEKLSERLSKIGENFGNGFVFRLDGDEDLDFDSDELNEKLRELSERLGEMKFNINMPDLDLDEDFNGNFHFDFRSSRPKLGVQLVSTTRELREHLGGSEDAGVLVSKVLPGMPAEEAGVQVGDLIMSVDGQPVGTSGDLIEALSDRSGDRIELEVLREGRTVRLDVELEETDVRRERSRSRGLRSQIQHGMQDAQDAYRAALETVESAAEEAQASSANDALLLYREAQSQMVDLSDTF